MKLNVAMQDLSFDHLAGVDPSEVEIQDVQSDSRRVQSNTLFVAIHGQAGDGHAFVQDALARGATALVVDERAEAPEGLCQLKVERPRRALGLVAARLCGQPSKKLSLVGVTGTNGKTTVTTLLTAIASAANKKCGLIGTNGIWIGEEKQASTHTTPDASVLQPLLKQMFEAGCELVFMEVSSHALDQERVAGCEYPVAVFTGLTRDHLDYHLSFDAYFGAKEALFNQYLLKDGTAVIQCDGEYGRKLSERLKGSGKRMVGCALDPRSLDAFGARDHAVQLCPRNLRSDLDGLQFELELESEKEPLTLRSPLVGRHNLENLLSAFGAALALKLPFQAIQEGLAVCTGPEGRLERVQDLKFGRYVFVDYAHTDDALRQVIQSLREASPSGSKLIVVFGCGGDRDRGKRPLMAKAASFADYVIVTSDNPRSEDPASIIAEIVPGLAPETRYAVEADRGDAIEKALGVARSGDVVLIAGKGHEDYQIVGQTRLSFDDRLVAKGALERVAPGTRELH